MFYCPFLGPSLSTERPQYDGQAAITGPTRALPVHALAGPTTVPAEQPSPPLGSLLPELTRSAHAWGAAQ